MDTDILLILLMYVSWNINAVAVVYRCKCKDYYQGWSRLTFCFRTILKTSTMSLTMVITNAYIHNSFRHFNKTCHKQPLDWIIIPRGTYFLKKPLQGYSLLISFGVFADKSGSLVECTRRAYRCINHFSCTYGQPPNEKDWKGQGERWSGLHTEGEDHG